MSFLILDTETTGLYDFTSPPEALHQPHLASWCMIAVNKDYDIEFGLDGLVRPDGWEMPADAIAVHGLTTDRLQSEGSCVAWPLHLFLRLYANGSRKLVAHNADFDWRIMRSELRRAGHPGPEVLNIYCAHGAAADAHACLEIFRALRLREALNGAEE